MFLPKLQGPWKMHPKCFNAQEISEEKTINVGQLTTCPYANAICLVIVQENIWTRLNYWRVVNKQWYSVTIEIVLYLLINCTQDYQFDLGSGLSWVQEEKWESVGIYNYGGEGGVGGSPTWEIFPHFPVFSSS